MSEIKHYIYPPTGVKHYGEVIDSKNGFDVIECKACGFKHVIPIPSSNELNKFYKKKYYEQERKKNYFGKQKSQLDWWDKIFEERCESFENILNKKGKILDIGCGPGFFMQKARSMGWEVLGIEPSIKASNYAIKNLNLDVVNCDLELIDENNKKLKEIDVVYTHGVLEHMRNPRSFFDFGNKVLSKGGVIFFSVANDYNPFQKILKEYKDFPAWWLVPPEHINYFNTKSARCITEQSGFEIVSLITTFPIDMFLMMGDDYISNPEVGSVCHQKRVNFESLLYKSGNKKLMKQMYTAFAQLGLGRQIEVIARKE